MEQTNGKKTGKLKRMCKICNKTVVGGPYKFRSHLYQHNAIASRFQCLYCSKEYFRKDAYNKHIATHRGTKKKYICDHCDRDFVDKRNLISHMQRVHDDYDRKQRQTFSCKACGIEYCEERLLKYHIRKAHFNLQEKQQENAEKQLNETWIERVLESDICVQITKVNNNVISIKKCDIVDKGEQKTDNWTNKAEPFKEYINSVFACIDKSQYSKAVCDYCNKEMLKKSLQNHMREKHLKVRRFKCENCKRSFYRHYQMMNHTCGKLKRRRRSNLECAVGNNQDN